MRRALRAESGDRRLSCLHELFPWRHSSARGLTRWDGNVRSAGDEGPDQSPRPAPGLSPALAVLRSVGGPCGRSTPGLTSRSEGHGTAAGQTDGPRGRRVAGYNHKHLSTACAGRRSPDSPPRRRRTGPGDSASLVRPPTPGQTFSRQTLVCRTLNLFDRRRRVWNAASAGGLDFVTLPSRSTWSGIHPNQTIAVTQGHVMDKIGLFVSRRLYRGILYRIKSHF